MKDSLIGDNLRVLSSDYNPNDTKYRSQLIRQVHAKAKKDEELRLEMLKELKENMKEFSRNFLKGLSYGLAGFSIGALMGVVGLAAHNNQDAIKKSFDLFKSSPTQYVATVISDEVKLPSLPDVKEDVKEGFGILEKKIKKFSDDITSKKSVIIPEIKPNLDNSIEPLKTPYSGLDAKIGKGILEKQKSGYKYVLDVPKAKMGQEVLVRIKTPQKGDKEFFYTKVDRFGRATFNLPVNPQEYDGYIKLKKPGDNTHTIQSFASIPIQSYKTNSYTSNYKSFVEDSFESLYENEKIIGNYESNLSDLERILKGERIDGVSYRLWEKRLDRINNELDKYNPSVIATTYNVILANKTIKNRVDKKDEKIIGKLDEIRSVLNNSYDKPINVSNKLEGKLLDNKLSYLDKAKGSLNKIYSGFGNFLYNV